MGESLTLADIADFDFVSLPQQTSLAQRLAAESAGIGRRLRMRIHVRSFDAMCQMVAAGLGIAVLPDAARAAVQPCSRICARWRWPESPWRATGSSANCSSALATLRYCRVPCASCSTISSPKISSLKNRVNPRFRRTRKQGSRTGHSESAP